MNQVISKIKLPGIDGPSYEIADRPVRIRVEALETTIASAMVFKGTVNDAATITALTNYKKGWSYKASNNFVIEGLGPIENGDMIICISDYAEAYSVTDWTVVQNNVDTMIGASTSADGSRGLVPAPTIQDSEKFLRGDGTWGYASGNVEWGYFTDLF